MTAENVARIIQLIVAPAVMISACAIILTGLLSRFGAINDRLRLMNRERLDLLRVTNPDPLTAERLTEIDVQLPDLRHRLRLQHQAVMTTYSAIMVFIISMFVIGLASVADFTWTAGAALVTFLVGMLTLLGGIVLTVNELRMSQRSIIYEVERVSKLDAVMHPEADKTPVA